VPALNTVNSTKTAQVGETLENIKPIIILVFNPLLKLHFCREEGETVFNMSMPVLVNRGCGSINAS